MYIFITPFRAIGPTNMNELPKDSEKEIWLHHNACGYPLYDMGDTGLVNTVEDDMPTLEKGKLHLDTYKTAMLGCEFEGEYVKNILTCEKIEPCKVGDKYQRQAYKNTEEIEKEMAENRTYQRDQ